MGGAQGFVPGGKLVWPRTQSKGKDKVETALPEDYHDNMGKTFLYFIIMYI